MSRSRIVQKETGLKVLRELLSKGYEYPDAEFEAYCRTGIEPELIRQAYDESFESN